MGSWGVGLFSNDVASDVREAFKDIVRLPHEEPRLLELLLAEFPSGRAEDDEDYADFWLAIADLFHQYALADEQVFATARRIVEDGIDQRVNRDLDMSDADLRRRQKVIEDRLERWSKPHPKPRARRTLKKPEPLLFEVGDCIVYPTMGRNGFNAFLPAAALADFVPDGWGAFVVFATARRYGFYATYLVARLAVSQTDRPTMDDCTQSVIAGLDIRVPGIPHDPSVKVVTATRAQVTKIAAEKIGRLEWDIDRLRATLPEQFSDLTEPSWSLSGLLSPYSDGMTKYFERPVKMKKLRLSQFVAGS